MQLTESEDSFFLALVRQEHVGAFVPLLGRAMAEQIDKRCKGQRCD
jgi:hypothetical protein